MMDYMSQLQLHSLITTPSCSNSPNGHNNRHSVASCGATNGEEKDKDD